MKAPAGGFLDLFVSPQDRDWPTLVKGLIAEYLGFTLFLFVTISTIASGCHLPDIAAATTKTTSSTLENAYFGSCTLESVTTLIIACSFGFAIFVTVYMTASFSGGHLNPAVSAGMLVARKISVLRFVLYVGMQMVLSWRHDEWCIITWTGGHLNPAVSAGMLVARKISVLRFVLYVGMQMAGACTGAGLARAIDHSGWHACGGGVNRLQPELTDAAGWGLETCLTFLLVFTVLAATDEARAVDTAHLPVLAPMAIGMAVFICHLVAIPLDGCSVNPARSFGAAAIAGTWRNQWVFWVGPICGGILAGLVYELLFRTRDSKETEAADGNLPEVQAALPAYTGARGLNETRQGPDNGQNHAAPPTVKRPAQFKHYNAGGPVNAV